MNYPYILPSVVKISVPPSGRLEIPISTVKALRTFSNTVPFFSLILTFAFYFIYRWDHAGALSVRSPPTDVCEAAYPNRGMLVFFFFFLYNDHLANTTVASAVIQNHQQMMLKQQAKCDEKRVPAKYFLRSWLQREGQKFTVEDCDRPNNHLTRQETYQR